MDEGVDVWRPVSAEHLGGDRYRLVVAPPEGEEWQFAKHDVVKCERRKLSGHPADDEVLVACHKSN
jgi:hypothetical protein